MPKKTDLFCVKWNYLSDSDFTIFGPFRSFEKAQEWIDFNTGKLIGEGEVFCLVPAPGAIRRAA